jgi:hypothetical protein
MRSDISRFSGVLSYLLSAPCAPKGLHAVMLSMKKQTVRTTVEIPVSRYRKLKAHAAARGRSARELILLGV